MTAFTSHSTEAPSCSYHRYQPFAFATRQISTSNRALVHEVIPYMDALTEHLDKFSQDETLTPAVRMAAKRGRLLLDKYYGLTDETIIYRIAMSESSLSSSMSCTDSLMIQLLTIFSLAPTLQDELFSYSRLAGRMDFRGDRPYPRRVDFALQARSFYRQREGPCSASFARAWPRTPQCCSLGK